jgi:hypothetical protein
MGWETDFLQSAVDKCTNPSGQITDCPLFTIQDETKMGSCNITLPAEIAKEDMLGPMPSLPGKVSVVGGPAYAKGAAPAQEGTTEADPKNTAESTSAPVPADAPGSKLASDAPVVPGAVFAAKATPSPPAADQQPAPTPAPPAAAASSVQTYFSTEYRTQGNVVNEILWVAKEVTVTASVTTTSAPKHKRHVHKPHGRSFHY